MVSKGSLAVDSQPVIITTEIPINNNVIFKFGKFLFLSTGSDGAAGLLSAFFALAFGPRFLPAIALFKVPDEYGLYADCVNNSLS